jgi:hypothetical protein
VQVALLSPAASGVVLLPTWAVDGAQSQLGVTLDRSSTVLAVRNIEKTPRRHQSGSIEQQLRISKAGNKQLRSLLVQCAQYLLGRFWSGQRS